MGRMSFLSPNQQCHSTEGNSALNRQINADSSMHIMNKLIKATSQIQIKVFQTKWITSPPTSLYILIIIFSKSFWQQEIRSMERVSAQCCFHAIPCTIIQNSRLPRTALFYWRYNGELAIYNGANSLDGFLMPAIAYCIVLYTNIWCLLRMTHCLCVQVTHTQ